MNLRIYGFYLMSLIFLGSCSGKYLKYEKAEQLKTNEEFEQKVKIVEVPSSANTDDTNLKDQKLTEKEAGKPDLKKDPLVAATKKNDLKNSKKTNSKNRKKESSAIANTKHEPELENSEGFTLRRPQVDPFSVGEEVVHKVFYDASLMDVAAGTLSLKVSPFVEVNGRKAYQFGIRIKSSDWFSSYYSVDDEISTLMDFENMIPNVFTMHVKESSQLRESKSFFDYDQMKAFYWEKKVTEKSGVEEKKLQWEILPYSQNVFSSLFYLRTFTWHVGKEYSFRVADDGENVVFRGKAVSQEVLKTEVGQRPAFKIKLEFTVKGVFKPVGDIYIWISDDEAKYILKIESKIKIGTLVSEVVSINPGQRAQPKPTLSPEPRPQSSAPATETK